MSQFNLDNITQYNTKAEDYEKLRKQVSDPGATYCDIYMYIVCYKTTCSLISV